MATIIADADWLDPRYWAGPRQSHSAVGWSSGNMLWLHAEIARLARQGVGDRQPSRLFHPIWANP
jgi:hypothetical protein